MFDLASSDPDGVLIDRTGIDEADILQIGELMGALVRLRAAEQTLTEASLRYMKLNQNDMRALHMLIATANLRQIATPGDIAAHLSISTASTTKLLDRLEQGGHIKREAHPTDRRALAISITEETREAAMNTVGRQQARRFHAAARLSRQEREAVIRFLNDMSEEILFGAESWSSEQ